jgi:hypothetical protein
MKRLRLKRNYNTQKKLLGADKAQLAKEYFSNMGRNIVSAALVWHKNSLRQTQDENEIIEHEGESNDSSWNGHEDSLLQVLEKGTDPYAGRKFGVSKRVQEAMTLRAKQWWKESKYPSCKKGFQEDLNVRNVIHVTASPI